MVVNCVCGGLWKVVRWVELHGRVVHVDVMLWVAAF